MSSIAERVAAGAALLDEKLPDWWAPNRIDLAVLDLSRPCYCVIGQVAPEREYGDAIEAGWLGLTFDDAYRYGFTAVTAAHASDWREVYPKLTAEWRRVITERRAAA